MHRPRRNVPRVNYFEGEPIPKKKKTPSLIRLERAPDPVMNGSSHHGQSGARLIKDAHYGDRIYFKIERKLWNDLDDNEKVHLIDTELQKRTKKEILYI